MASLTDGIAMTVETSVRTEPQLELKFRWFLLVIGFWCLASIAGTVGQYLPREALLSTADGRGIGACDTYNREAVLSGEAMPQDWCTTDQVIGGTLPPDVRFSSGGLSIANISWADVLEAFIRPDLWLTVGIGGIAIVFIYIFAQGTGTLRAGLAAGISIVFFGFLLFPAVFTERIPVDMRRELVSAWQWVIIFYFGSEAAVQAWKVSHPKGSNIPGDVPTKPAPNTPTAAKTTDQAAVEVDAEAN